MKDLSARLFYDPWVQFNLKYGDNGHKDGLYKAHVCCIDSCGGIEVDYFETETLEKEWSGTIEDIKPYLRPMPSMTEEESEEYRMFIDYSYNDFTSESTPCVYVDKINDYLDWLNAHHFDFRNLIDRGLAIDCTGLNIY